MFESANTDAIKTRRPMTILVSTAGQAAVTAAIVIATIVQVDSLPKMKLADVLPVVPLQPRPVQKIPGAAVRTVRVEGPRPFVYREPSQQALANAPIVIIDDAPVTGFERTGDSVPTGGGSGIFTGLPPSTAIAGPPPAPPEPVKKPPQPSAIRVSEGVQGAKLIHQPRPIYPHLARTARISGRVRLDAVISRDGAIQNLRVIDGHPMLVNAAIDAVSQWRYQPTLLNGVPVEVMTLIEVNFTLGNP